MDAKAAPGPGHPGLRPYGTGSSPSSGTAPVQSPVGKPTDRLLPPGRAVRFLFAPLGCAFNSPEILLTPQREAGARADPPRCAGTAGRSSVRSCPGL
ncbi:hypothetical protein DGo_CA0446 [Deinococcus gobiensis I-0]|uniref:Uncharacterized protein n=1 Tax=Deinococcus gobiensis (strain DSM 21396 / JCM 16679 / CGMCC 1.7299 / I-0) TaxID=745776 RepID=H8GW08_DEIGI|nr:hypothetical protein DGo_CA0446 [Deinococcus gobiensis I-0]